MKNLKKCPICGEEKLQYSQTADIWFKYDEIESVLLPQLDENSIGWRDSIYLYCDGCRANSDDNKELTDLIKEYEEIPVVW